MLSTVRTSLLARLVQATALRVVTEGENFQPKSLTDYPFARFTMRPRESSLNTIGVNGVTQEAGFLSIHLWYSRNINTIDDALEEAESILSAFTPSVEVEDDEQLIIEMSWIEGVQHETNVFGIPIFVRFVNLNI